MITDELLRFSNAQTLPTTAGTNAPSTNIVNLVAPRDIGHGQPLYVVLTFSADTAAAATSVLTVTLESDSVDTGFATAKTVQATVVLDATALAGEQIVFQIPQIIGQRAYKDAGSGVEEPFIALRYAVSTANITAGTVTADIVMDVQDGKKFYDSGFTVA